MSAGALELRDVIFSGAGVTGSGKPFDIHAGNRTQVFC